MFRTLSLAALALASGPALAQDAARCADLAATAAKVMEARQLGIPEAELMALAQDGAAAPTLTWMVGQAYEEPIYPAAQHPAAIDAFARGVQDACLRG